MFFVLVSDVRYQNFHNIAILGIRSTLLDKFSFYFPAAAVCALHSDELPIFTSGTKYSVMIKVEP